MGKKYIVELGRCERLYKAYINGNGKPNLTWLSTEVDLTPYTEPDLEQVRKEAYEDGYKTAKVQCNIQAEKDLREVGERHYKKGLSDAWEAARKIQDAGGNLSWWIHNTTAAEAIEKLKAYEQEQEEIKVGDEVEMKCGVRPAIYMQGTKGSDEIYLLFNDGSCGVHSKSEIERKTGRHFPEIAAVFEKMRGEQEKQEKDAEIKVGKEFQMGKRKCVVTHIIDGTQRRVLWDNGVSGLVDNTDLFANLTPTGRYFPEIVTILENMRGENDD